ncbi:acyl carrier protein [Methanofollis sp. W23]|uniref:acyl carrier protein n=1 Tax=Methanofollis sp. W23 TaxID=2817849 RepID=UPI001AE67691|nr:acyl carrier protein [Methanofollis sp. W23]MBP2146222.1 acyl carrier protein [Methanofollis sp. W23]
MEKGPHQRIEKIFCEIIGVRASDLTDEIGYNTHELWDSLKHLELVAALEEAFGITLDMDEIVEMEDFGKVRAVVFSHLEEGAV